MNFCGYIAKFDYEGAKKVTKPHCVECTNATGTYQFVCTDPFSCRIEDSSSAFTGGIGIEQKIKASALLSKVLPSSVASRLGAGFDKYVSGSAQLVVSIGPSFSTHKSDPGTCGATCPQCENKKTDISLGYAGQLELKAQIPPAIEDSSDNYPYVGASDIVSLALKVTAGYSVKGTIGFEKQSGEVCAERDCLSAQLALAVNGRASATVRFIGYNIVNYSGGFQCGGTLGYERCAVNGVTTGAPIMNGSCQITP